MYRIEAVGQDLELGIWILTFLCRHGEAAALDDILVTDEEME